MYRSAFKTVLREGAFTVRRFNSTARTTRTTNAFTAPRALAGATLLASIFISFPATTVNNDVDEQKVAKDKKVAKEAVKAVKETEEKKENEENEENEVKEEKEVKEETEEKEQKEETENEKETESSSEGLEESADAEEEQPQAAFNPETGEINWDCPCLGGMADGPCGEEFKEAFACFVYSETEPKGIDCIKKFENMRTCFKQHPEHYKEELYEDDEVPSVEVEVEETTEVVVEEA